MSRRLASFAAFFLGVSALACRDEPASGARPEASGASSAVAAAAPTERDRLRDEARLVLERHCGPCHLPQEAGALPRALAVFDLGELEWAARMTDAQLLDARGRLDGPMLPDGAPSLVTDTERATFTRYREAEVARRAGR